jgi:hypothetical protein
MREPNYITLFVDATIKATFCHYGIWQDQKITVNGLINISPKNLLQLDKKLIEDYGKIVYAGHEYEVNEVRYEITFTSINRVYEH